MRLSPSNSGEHRSPTMKRRMSSAEALANHFGWDVADMREHRYQPTRTPCPIFSTDDGYYAATSGALPKEWKGFRWKQEDSWVTRAYQKTIWRAVPLD